MRLKRAIAWTAACAVVILAVISTVTTVSSISPKSRFTVVLDAGHGGVDGGVVGVNTGVKESDLNLEITLEVKKLLEKSGVKTVLTRPTKSGLYGTSEKGFKRRDMLRRKEIINSANADAAVSIHLNYYQSPSRRGAQAFFKRDDDKSRTLAEIIQENLNSLDSQPRKYSALEGDYYILNQSAPPAALVEGGFLSNAEDEALLVTSEYREKLAAKIADAIFAYLTVREAC